MTIAATYFEGQYRFIAISLTSLGAGVSVLAMPYMLVYLEEEFGLRGTFLILGCLVLHTVPCVYTMVLLKLDNSVVNDKKHDISCTKQNNPNTLRKVLKCICNLISNKEYLMGPVCIAFGTAILGVLVFLVVDVLISKGYSKSDGVFALFLMSIASLFGRISPALCKLCPHTSIFTVPVIVYLLGGTALILLPSVTNYSFTFVLTSVVGLSHGASICSIFSTSTKVVSKEVFAIAAGSATTVLGVGTVCIPPLTG